MQTYPQLRFIRGHVRTLMLLLLLALVIPAAPPTAFAVINRTVAFENLFRTIAGSSKTTNPWVVVDSNNKAHMVYIDENDEQLMYVNNINGTLSSPKPLDRFVGNVDPVLALGPGNTLHLGYSRGGDGIYYQQGTQNGSSVTWSGRVLISAEDKSFGGYVVVDSAGNAHFAWIDQRCGQYNVFYRVRLANGVLGPVSAPKGDCAYQTRARLVLTNDGKPHALFQRDREIYYARLESTGWVNRQVSDGRGRAHSPTMTTDGVALYISWAVSVGTDNHDVLFRRSTDGGQNWSSVNEISATPEWAAFPSLTWSPTSGRVYIVWSDETGTTETEVWFREFDPVSGETSNAYKVSRASGASDLPVIAVGPTRAEVVWQDRADGGVLRVRNDGGNITGAGCKGTMALTGSFTLPDGTPATNDTNIAGTIAPDAGCTPQQMQLSVDTPIDASTPKQNYSASFNVPIQASETCVHTVYGRLIANGVDGEIFSAKIVVDTQASAFVRVANPFLPTNTPVFTPSASPGGALGGALNYTRNGQIYLDISNEDDCVGLKDFSMPGKAATIANNSYRGYVPLPNANTGEGIKTFQVTVRDNLNNGGTFPSNVDSFSVTYDTTAPELDMNEDPTVTTPVSTTEILVDLDFSDIHVSDNLYGNLEGLDDDAEFWGVYLANSREMTPTGALNWYPVEVGQPGPSFSIKWSLFSGLNYGTALDKQGSYFVFVKFVDGAGNVSVEQIRAAEITLEPNYRLPTLLLPTIRH